MHVPRTILIAKKRDTATMKTAARIAGIAGVAETVNENEAKNIGLLIFSLLLSVGDDLIKDSI